MKNVASISKVGKMIYYLKSEKPLATNRLMSSRELEGAKLYCLREEYFNPENGLNDLINGGVEISDTEGVLGMLKI